MITTNTPDNIELLPEHIIDQIKAGEVLERPASLIKELIENSIDANADEISIQIIDNGMELIAIEDNGKGMSFKNLPYAFLRHATSKIKKYEDLFHLHSYGFRGEALASVAASSRVTCQTQPRNLNEDGGKIIINGGMEELLVPMKNSTYGTSLFIKNLFYNTPARLKFIKSKTSERINLKKMLTSFLLSHPEIQFSIKWDDKEKEVYKKSQIDNYEERFKQIVFGRQKEQTPILSASSNYEGHSVKVLFTLEALKNSPNKHQYLFANGRMFYDKSLHQAIIRSTDQIWKFGETGHYMIIIECPSEDIDVNVHPNKTQLKFAKSDIIYSLLVNSIKDAIKKYYAQNTTVLEKTLHHDSPSELTLFTEEQSLFDIKNKSFESKAIPSSTMQIVQENSQALTHYFKLTNNFIILNIPHQQMLVSKFDLYFEYLNFLVNQSLSKEENIAPLLISEPFKFQKMVDPHFEILKKWGFEFDRLNNDVIVLRTIPRIIHRDFIRPIAETLLLYVQKSKQDSMELNKKMLKLIVIEKNILSTVDISTLTHIIESQINLVNIKGVNLNDEILNSIYEK